MENNRTKVFKGLIHDLRKIGAENVAAECEKLGPDGTVNRLRGGVNSLCRGLPSAEQVAEMLRAFRDTRP